MNKNLIIIITSLILFSCAPNTKKSIEENANFEKKIDTVSLKEKISEISNANEILNVEEPELLLRRIDYSNKSNTNEKTEIKQEYNLRDYLPNQNISISFDEIDLHTAFYTLADIIDRNIVIDDSVVGSLSIDLSNEPWDIAVLTIAKLKNLALDVETETGLLQVYSKARYNELKPEETIPEEKRIYSTAAYNIFFNPAPEIKDALETFLTDEEKEMTPVLEVNEATNTIIATADDQVLDRIEILLEEIDKKVKQVYFEVFIVTASDNFAYEFGSRLGLYGTGENEILGNNGVLTTTSGIIGSSAPTAESDIAFGSSVGSLFNGLINGTSGIGLITDVGAATFKAELDMLESDGVSTTISNPKILLTNGKTGEFKQTVQFTTITEPTEGEPEQISGEAGLILELTPFIGPDNSIKLKYYLEDSSVGTAVKGQVPDKTLTSIGSKSQPIEMYMKNQEIVVLGGLYTSTESDSSQGVPGTNQIPGLRWLTNNKEIADNQKELLFFIIPTIL